MKEPGRDKKAVDVGRVGRHRVDNIIDYIGIGLAGAFVVGCGRWWATGHLPIESPVLHAVLILTGAVTCSLLLCWAWLALADFTRGVPPLLRHRRRRRCDEAGGGSAGAVCEEWGSALPAGVMSDLERELEALRAHAGRLAELAVREQRPDLYRHLVRRALVQVGRGWERQTGGAGSMTSLLPQVHRADAAARVGWSAPLREAALQRGGRRAA